MKRIAVIVTLLSLAMTLAASGAAEDDGRITITWWHSNSGVIGEAADALVEKFNRTIGEENGIYVEAIYQGSANDTLTKVRTVAQAGDPSMLPDLVQLDSTGVVDMAGNESLYYVEDLAGDQGEDLSFILDHALESMRYRGKVIGLPFNASTLLFYYNRTLFDQLGLEAPRTLDDLIKAAPALIARDDKGNVTRYAIASVPTTYELCSFIGMQHGLSYITDMSNGHDGTPTRTLFEDDGTLHDFLVKWKELYETGGLNNLTSGVSAEFAAGRTASMLASTSNLTSVQEAVGGRFELGVANVPMVNEDATGGVNLSGGALFTFHKDAQKEKAVWTFMKYLTSAQAQLEWHIATGYLPVNKDTYTMQEYIDHTQANPLFKVASDQLLASNAKVTGLWIPNAYQVYYSFQAGIRSMLEEGRDVDETVSALADEIDGYLDEYHSINGD